MEGTAQSQVLTWIAFEQPKQRIYVYADGTRECFEDIRKVFVLKTLCHVLVTGGRHQYIVYPRWRYIIEE